MARSCNKLQHVATSCHKSLQVTTRRHTLLEVAASCHKLPPVATSHYKLLQVVTSCCKSLQVLQNSVPDLCGSTSEQSARDSWWPSLTLITSSSGTHWVTVCALGHPYSALRTDEKRSIKKSISNPSSKGKLTNKSSKIKKLTKKERSKNQSEPFEFWFKKLNWSCQTLIQLLKKNKLGKLVLQRHWKCNYCIPQELKTRRIQKVCWSFLKPL